MACKVSSVQNNIILNLKLETLQGEKLAFRQQGFKTFLLGTACLIYADKQCVVEKLVQVTAYTCEGQILAMPGT